MPNDTRTLRVIRDGRRREIYYNVRLPRGVQANFVTLNIMRRIVREDAAEPDIRNWVMRDIIGLDKQNLNEQIQAAFVFARDKIIYREEQDGWETVADLWSCMYKLDPLQPVGDCAIKCVALATILALLGLKPEFIAIGQAAAADDFNHVYISIFDSLGRPYRLDPTPPEFRPGDELPAYRRVRIPIF